MILLGMLERASLSSADVPLELVLPREIESK